MEIKPILLDTNAYTAFKRNVSDSVEIIKNSPLIGLNSVILGELLGGFAVGTKEAVNRSELQQFLSIEKVKVFVIDTDTAEYYAIVYRGLRTKGNPIPTNDIWIAATALQHNLGLFSYDKHFQAVDGLVIGTCLSDFMVK
ncbi:MAG: type II toxin-antitoxin system VapC family toxin [Cyanobacteria bacterium P01_H01_bin.35]